VGFPFSSSATSPRHSNGAVATSLAVRARGAAVREAFDLKDKPLKVKQSSEVTTNAVPVVEYYYTCTI